MRCQCFLPWRVISPAQAAAEFRGYGVRTTRPLPFGADELAQHQVRRRAIRVHGTATVRNVADEERTFTFDETQLTVLGASMGSPHKEREQVPTLNGYGTSSVVGSSFTGDAIGGFVEFTATIPEEPDWLLSVKVWVGGSNAYDSADNSNEVVKDGDTYWMPVKVNVGVSTGSLLYTALSFDAAGDNLGSGLACNFFGAALPLYNHAPDEAFTGGNIIIEAPTTDGFIEYRDTGGANPIYDSDTGEPLFTTAEILLLR